MRYFKFRAETPYTGCWTETFEAFEENDVTEDLLEEYAEELCYENAETYEYYATGWDEDFETEEDREEYYSNCSCYYEEITKEEYEESL